MSMSWSLSFLLLFVCLLPQMTSALKFLAWNPLFGHSHANFIGKVADTLAEAGHEVVMLSPITHSGNPTVTSKHARMIYIAGNEYVEQYRRFQDDSIREELWTGPQTDPTIFTFLVKITVPFWAEMCRLTLNSPGLLDQLRTEKFDGAFSEYLDLCGFGIFHLLGIKKYAVTQTMASIDDSFITGVPLFPSCTPSLTSLHGEQMSFMERISNMYFIYYYKLSYDYLIEGFNEVFEEYDKSVPSVDEIVKKSSYFFLNTDPLVDFPRITSHKMVDIGGIAVPSTFKPLEKTLSSLLSLRPHTVFISFGSIMRAHVMPEKFKRSIRALALALPNVTFIWKYERPEHNIAQGIPNLITHTWLPQTDLLRDKRLSMFVGHGGAGSTYETALSGVPTVTVPVIYDQMRNAEMLKRLGIGRIVKRDDLATPEVLIEAVRDVLENVKYRERAARVAEMVAAQPQSVRDRLVTHFEFMAKFGPLDQLDHAGREMGVIQFYNIDIFASFAAAILIVLIALLHVLKMIVNRCIGLSRTRTNKNMKTE